MQPYPGLPVIVDREEMASVRQEHRENAAGAAGEFTHLAAGLRDPFHRAEAAEQNIAAGTPGAAASGQGVAEDLDRPSRTVDLFQLGIGKESDEPAVRRPEGIVGSIGAGESSRLRGVERADPDLLLSIFDENHR